MPGQNDPSRPGQRIPAMNSTTHTVGPRRDGTNVTLHASNGRWIWKLTGRSWCSSFEPGAEPLVMLEGIWPD